MQNYKDYLNWQKNNTKSMNYCTGHLATPRSIHCSNCGNMENGWSIAETTLLTVRWNQSSVWLAQ